MRLHSDDIDSPQRAGRMVLHVINIKAKAAASMARSASAAARKRVRSRPALPSGDREMSLSANLHRDATRLHVLGFRDAQAQHALVELCANLVRIKLFA